MRISWLVRIWRAELYIGRRPESSPEWEASRFPRGYCLLLGRWQILLSWLMSKREHARRSAELLALYGDDDPEASTGEAQPC
jgi:hypothetical protein